MELHAVEHVLSFQRRVAAIKKSFLVRGKAGPLGRWAFQLTIGVGPEPSNVAACIRIRWSGANGGAHRKGGRRWPQCHAPPRAQGAGSGCPPIRFRNYRWRIGSGTPFTSAANWEKSRQKTCARMFPEQTGAATRERLCGFAALGEASSATRIYTRARPVLVGFKTRLP